MLGRCSVGRCSVGAHHAAHGELGHLPALPLRRLVGHVLALLQRPQVMHLVRVSNAAAPTGNAPGAREGQGWGWGEGPGEG